MAHKDKPPPKGKREAQAPAKGDDKTSPVWIYGVQPVLEALHSGNRRFEKIWMAYGRSGPECRKVLALAKKKRIPVSQVDRSTLEKKAGTPKHQGLLALVSQVVKVDLDGFLEAGSKEGRRFLALLDGIQDPGNLGAIMRTAYAAGVEGLLLPEHGVCPITPSVIKASAGAGEWVPLVHVGNASQALRVLAEQGILILGADAEGERRIYDVDLTQDLCLVLGGEGKGLRPGLRKVCDEIVSLPMPGPIASLNVSVASGVLFYEVVRQRGWKES